MVPVRRSQGVLAALVSVLACAPPALADCPTFTLQTRITTSTGSGPVEVASADFRSKEHTSELQSQFHLVCRILLEKKKHALPTAAKVKTTSTTTLSTAAHNTLSNSIIVALSHPSASLLFFIVSASSRLVAFFAHSS